MISKGKKSQIRSAFRSVYGDQSQSDQNVIRYGNEIIFRATPYPFEDDTLTKLRFSSINAIEDSDAIAEYLTRVPSTEFSGKNNTTYGRMFELGKKYKVGYKGSESTAGKEARVLVEDFGEESSKEDSTSAKKDETPAPSHEEAPTHEPKEDLIPEPKDVAPINPVSYDIPPDKDMAGNGGMESGSVAHYTNSSAPVSSASSEKPETKNTNEFIKEEKTMAEQTAYEKMVQKGAEMGIGTSMTANVTGVSKTDREAAAKAVADTQTQRIAYSENSKIKKVLCTQIDRTKKAVNGIASMGTVSDPHKALSKFIAVTGCDVKDGVVSFSKLHASELSDNAMKMYTLLKEACENPKTPVKPYFGKTDAEVPVSVKGIVLDDPDGTEKILQQRDIAAHILAHAFLYLNVDSATKAQFMLDAASSKGSTPKRSYVIRVANKAEMLKDKDVCVMVKNIVNKQSENKTGYRSELAVVVNTSRLTPSGEPKKTTWRIPLEVEQFEVEVVDKYSELFKAGLAHSVKPMSADTSANIGDILSKITAIIAAESVKSSDKSALSADMRAAINDARSEMQADNAKSVNESLNGGAAPEDFN